MIRFLGAGLSAAALLTAPVAAADPQILVPQCSGQVAESGECTPNPLEGFFGDALGANPNIPLGLMPLDQPVVAPLGPVPQNLPGNLPLGPTPPNVSGR
jgi:hypothetical protein